jgi:hypothetical protein
MAEVFAEYGGKLKECEEILATIPASAMKLKAASVQHLLASNSDLMTGKELFSTVRYGNPVP